MITPEAGVVIARRYTLTRPLARGAMGSVWVARHRDLDIDVTVKFMDASLFASADARTRFEHEARSAARLDSQHVVQVLDYGIESDTPYIVMELLKGETLATRLSREGRLQLPAAARLVVQIGKALRTAHEAGLVHRDLKPGNIFLAIKDEDEVAKVLDFGIAKTMVLGDAPTGTQSGTVLGSAHYMSPEQVRDSSAVDHRSDLWSLGVILYRTLVGRLPFLGKDFGDILVRVCTDPLPRPSSIAPDLPARLDGFFVRALARDPAQRFQTARELAEGFCTIAMSTEPVSSSQPSEKRTVRMDLLSVPPPPPSSDVRFTPPVAQTDAGTHIMLVQPGAAWPPPPPPADDGATVARSPESAARRHAMEVEPTLRAAQPVTAMPAAAPIADDPPTIPVSSVWPLWAAAALLVAGGLIFAAFRLGGSKSVAAPAAATAASSAVVAEAVATVSAAATAPPVHDGGFASKPLAQPAVDVEAAARSSATVTAAPAASLHRRGGNAPVKVEDGIIRDPFKP